MAFKSKRELNGELDPSINVKGRPVGGDKPLTNRQIRERDFLSFLRKIKPHVAEAINAAVKIMGNTQASDANKLKAATIILQEYKDALGKVYDKDYDESEGIEAQPVNKAPVFSLTMVKNGEEVK